MRWGWVTNLTITMTKTNLTMAQRCRVIPADNPLHRTANTQPKRVVQYDHMMAGFTVQS